MNRLDAWSRRKAAVEAEEREIEAVAVARRAEAEEAELAKRDDAELLEEFGLPEPEALETPEAVREFLDSGLPQRLKTRALRRLWRLNPTLANLDGLVDYGEDYTDAALVIDNLQTAYQVGKGMMAHVKALAEQAEAADAPEMSEPAMVEEDGTDATDMALATETPKDTPAVTQDPGEQEEVAEPRRCRMSFAFPATETRGAA